MLLSKHALPVVVTMTFVFFIAFQPAFSQECAAYPWNARLSVRGGCKRTGARCTTEFVDMDPVGKCKTINGSNPYERECWCIGRRTLRRAATGGQVREVQAKLAVITDGIFGYRTEAAVRAFQREHQLVPDGIVGPETWAALDAAGSDAGGVPDPEASEVGVLDGKSR
jgi:Putative peptidoglycan binding domain